MTASAPTARDACRSVSGIQLVPPSVLFHTPPEALPTYIPSAPKPIAVTRPVTVIRAGVPHSPLALSPCPLVIESGPMKIHWPATGLSAGIAPIAATARVRAIGGTRLEAALNAT